jgi:hypothetical protein
VSETLADILFDEFALRHARGEGPDVREYLTRAGMERDELGRMIDRYLQAAPARRATEEETVLMQARIAQEPPLLVLRQRRKLGRQAVVDGLVALLRIDTAKADKVSRYYHELEVGLLDAARVNRRVWSALRDLLGADVESLVARPLRPEPPTAAAAIAYLRASDLSLSETPAPTPSTPEEPDEIDRLFTGGP